jgi:hypothetical protein
MRRKSSIRLDALSFFLQIDVYPNNKEHKMSIPTPRPRHSIAKHIVVVLLLLGALLTSCVSPVIESRRVELEKAAPAAAKKPAPKPKLPSPKEGSEQGTEPQNDIPAPIYPSTKPFRGIAYSLPMVHVHLTAILTNVPNPALPLTNILVTTVSNSVSEVDFINSTNSNKPFSITNTTLIVSSNSFLSARVDTNSVIPTYLVMVEPIISPDPNFVYSLEMTENIASSDTLGFSVDPTNNFLQTVNATNVDQTIQIVENLAKTAATLYTMGAGAPLGGLPTALPDKSIFEKKKVKLREPLPGRVEIFFDPSSSDDMDRARKSLTDIFVENDGGNPNQAEELCPLRLSVSFNRQIISQKTGDYLKTHRPDNAKGVLYRPMLPYFLQVNNSYGQNGTNLIQYLIRSPNAAPVFSLPVDRALLVTRTTSLSFNNGFLQGANYNNPSQLSALLGLPLTVIGDIFSSVTNLLQLRFNIATGQNNVATQQTALLNQQAAINTATTNLLESIKRLQAYQAGMTNHP